MKHIPKSAWLTVNRACNLRCRWCYAEDTEFAPHDNMKWELAQKLTALCKEINIGRLFLIGGEPTLWPHILKLNKLCHELKLPTVLVTNAMRFGSDKFWDEYNEYPNDSIGISLKAANELQLKEVARVDSFKHLEKGLKRAIKHFKLSVGVIYNKLYIDNFTDIVQYAMDCGAKGVGISFAHPSFKDGIANKDFMVNPLDTVKNIVKDYDKLVQITGGNLSIDMSLPLCIWPREFVEKLKARNQMTTLCHLVKRRGIIFDVHGELLNCNSLFDFPIGQYEEDFTDGSSLLGYLATEKPVMHYDKMCCYPSTVCMKCDWHKDCGGGCPLNWTVYDPKKIIKLKPIIN